MALPKTFIIGTVVVFGCIGLMAIIKKSSNFRESLGGSTEVVQAQNSDSVVAGPGSEDDEALEVDRIPQLFALDSTRLPVVETISYTSRVPWMKDRPAWISDYATYYSTSRHFIARSLNRKPDYLTQKVSPGDRFNVLRKDKNLSFYLVIDLSRCKMWFYYLDNDSNERVLLKTYRVGVGRSDEKRESGCLTPVGTYTLGEKIAIYRPGMTDTFQEKKTEMIRIFGTRWIPFGQEVGVCSEPAKGLGIHGAPWITDPSTGGLVEDRDRVGEYNSDGCIRLFSEDMEELFAIVVSRPTKIELVRDFHEANLPGTEVSDHP